MVKRWDDDTNNKDNDNAKYGWQREDGDDVYNDVDDDVVDDIEDDVDDDVDVDVDYDDDDDDDDKDNAREGEIWLAKGRVFGYPPSSQLFSL